MADLHTVPVLEVRSMAAGQVLLRVDVSGSALQASHQEAGQYAQVALFADDVPRPFALANALGSPVFEFLIKLPEERLAEVSALGVGDEIQVSSCEGPGFGLGAVVGQDLLFLGVGSGIAPLRATLETVLNRRAAWGAIHFLYGVRYETELCFRDDFARWRSAGVEVIPVVSRPSSSWSGATGHVQHHLGTVANPGRCRAFVCGLPAMESDVTAALAARDVGGSQIHRNW